MVSRSFLFGLGLMGLGVGLAVQLRSSTLTSSHSFSDALASQPIVQIGALPDNATIQSVQKRAQAITVKVLTKDAWGSGILVHRQGNLYTVLTNQHVIHIGAPYRVQTPDGRIYKASAYPASNFRKYDLAFVQFKADSPQYTIATFGKSETLRAGDPVFASGFPFEGDNSRFKGFRFTEGKVSLIVPKALDGGYRLGYSNDVVKGMSGGPVLNRQGRVVAVNGMHAYPLWGDPYIFQDGSKPSQSQRIIMVKSSWAIPIERVMQLAPKNLHLAESRLTH
jgi:S1-C subfamily serine protease